MHMCMCVSISDVLFVVLLQEIQILKALVLGEEERGQSQYQVMCFVTRLSKSDFISTDAMSKLRQVRFHSEYRIILLFTQVNLICLRFYFTKIDIVFYYFAIIIMVYIFGQKNPSTIRQPEEDRGRENYTMTSWVNLPFSSPISRHVAALCNEAADATYISDFDINILASKPGKNLLYVIVLC